MYLDQVTEAIAHFIGLFHTTVEQARLRENYDEFKAAQAVAKDMPVPETASVHFNVPYSLDDPDPGIHYVPPAWDVVEARVYTHVTYDPPEISVPWEFHGGLFPMALPGIAESSSPGVVEYEIAPPGSMVARIAQETGLEDNDSANVGGHGLVYAPVASAAQPAVLDALLEDATGVAPLDPDHVPGDGEAIGTFVVDAIETLKDLADDTVVARVASNASEAPGSGEESTVATTFVAQSDTALDGHYVDGELRVDQLELDSFLPEKSILADDAVGPDGMPSNQGVNGPASSATGDDVSGMGPLDIDPSVQLDAGENALVNDVSLTNLGLDGAVFAVSGNHVELNAIVQTNAWSDSDSIGQTLAGWRDDPFTTTAAFNIAAFDRIDPGSQGGSDPGTADAGWPHGWAVTQITGDLIFMNWIQQFNFVMDQDVHVLASSGVETMVTTGENLAFNDISIDDLGNYYDLVLVGGSLYDANIVSQTNVLLDDDIVGAVDGFSTSGHGSVSTGDNLLWNQASITNIGAADRFSAITDDYRATLDSFAAGSTTVHDGVLHDEAFAGMSGLRVLYVSGSIRDLQYVSQTNVLGDSDEVALAMHTAAAGARADWSVTTGSNVLANSASIVDLDTGGQTYVGGDQYSYELLIQTEIIRTDHLAEIRDADALVNEAVAFLGEDMLTTDHASELTYPGDTGDVMTTPAYHDIMQSVVS